MAKEIKKHYRSKKLGTYPSISVVLSITLALFVAGIFALLIVHANALSRSIQENIEMQVYLNKFASENDKIRIYKTLADKDYVAFQDGEPGIRLISKEEAAEAFIQETGEDFIEFLGENPLRDAYAVRINADFQDSTQMRLIKQEIETMAGVFEVTYVENLVNSIRKNITKISLILMGFVLVLLFAVVILINNTIKLALFSQRFLIRSMQLVGATGSFIKRPFLWRATWQGFLAGCLSVASLGGLLYYAYQSIEDLSVLFNFEQILLVMVGILLLGMLVAFLSTLAAMNKYLKLSLDDLY